MRLCLCSTPSTEDKRKEQDDKNALNVSVSFQRAEAFHSLPGSCDHPFPQTKANSNCQLTGDTRDLHNVGGVPGPESRTVHPGMDETLPQRSGGCCLMETGGETEGWLTVWILEQNSVFRSYL